jgi:hypothetical protein
MMDEVLVSCPGLTCPGCEAKAAAIATLTAENAALQKDYAKEVALSDERLRYIQELTRFLGKTGEERDALRAKVAELEQDLADCQNALAQCH